MDLKPHQGSVEEPIYTVFSLWDTFRAYHPLMTIIDPDLNEAFIRSLIRNILCGNWPETIREQ